MKKRRCEKGDFAVWVGVNASPTNPNLGKVVRCIRWLGRVEGRDGDDRWEVDGPITTMTGACKGQVHYTARDCGLQPLRGTAAEIVAQLVALRLSL